MTQENLDWSTKATLVKGAVKPWHVVFLYSVGFAVSTVASHYMTMREAPGIRNEMHDLTWRAINSTIILLVTIVVPEFRRSLAVLFAAPRAKIAYKDIALTVGVVLAWGYGLYRIALCFPFIYLDVERYYGTFLFSQLGDFRAKYLLMLIGTTITAPLAEELIFRGYLLNLWAVRWGITTGIVLSSLLFALFHFHAAPFALPMGIAFSLVYLKYDSLWPAIALHSLYNALAFPWVLGVVFYQKDRASANQLSSWVPEMLLALVFVPFAIAFWRRFKPSAG